MTRPVRSPAAPSGPADRRRPGLMTALVVVWGPGLLVMLADTDVGNVVTAAQAGAQSGYRLLPLILLLIPLLYMIQELTVRLGLFTGRGFGELVRTRFGNGWALAAGAALVVATVGSMITELVGIAGVGEMYGISRNVAVPVAAFCLLVVVLTDEYRVVERTAAGIGMFLLAFLVVAFAAHPSLTDIGRDITRQDLSDQGYLYLVAALIGATFNPWMIFYQPSALTQKRLGETHLAAARWDTATGAVITQVLTASVVVAAAATLGSAGGGVSVDSVGRISEALTPFLGATPGRLAFGAGVIGAAMVAAIVCSLAFAWGMGDLAGVPGGAQGRVRRRRWFVASYAGCVLGGAGIVLLARDLIWLTILTQVVNALLLPILFGLLIGLSVTALPPARRPRGAYLWCIIIAATLAGLAGVAGVIGSLA